MRLFMKAVFFWYLSFILAVLGLIGSLPAAGSSFRVPPFYTVGLAPAGVASGDFNGDGKPDLVVANANGSSISVLLNNGNGTFAPAVTYYVPLSDTPVVVAVADLNGDGMLDVVTVGSWAAGGQLVVFLGNGDGTFQTGVAYLFGGQFPGDFLIADMNGDGKPDLVVVSQVMTGTDDSLLSVLLGNGDGTFQQAINTTQTFSSGTADTIVAGDFNHDSKTDLGMEIRGKLYVMLGNGNGTFQDPVLYITSSLQAITAGDMNNDGKLDLVAVGDAGVSVFLGNGDGTFQSATSASLPVGSSQAIFLTDLNSDGNLDVIVGGSSPSSALTLLGDGAGGLGSPTIYAVGSGASHAGGVLGQDLNGDGHPDVVSSNDLDGTITVMLGSSTGTLAAPVVPNYIAGVLVTGDFNKDGKLDVVSNFVEFNTFELFLGEGNGNLQVPTSFPTGTSPEYITAADFNSDGNLDVATANSTNISVVFGNGDGTFQSPVNYAGSSNLGRPNTYVQAVDVNGDGKPDLAVITRAVGNSSSNTVGILLNSGNGTFLPAVQYTAKGSVGSVAFADFNGDGKIDMATIDNAGPFALGIFLGNGDGTFRTRMDETFDVYCNQMIAADVNGDGKQDLVLGCGFLTVLLGNGDGTFQAPIYNLNGNVGRIFAADFNGDGKLDIAGVPSVGIIGDLDVYYGNGDGTFSFTNYGIEAQDIAAGNFNRDNALDLVVYNGSGTFVLPSTGGTSDVLVSSRNPSKANQEVTFKATVAATVKGSPGKPTGSVTFMDRNTPLGTVTLQKGVAEYKTSTLTVGAHPITAVYSGDSNFNPNVSAVLDQVVKR